MFLIISFLAYFTLFSFACAQTDVGDLCAIKNTGSSGICALFSKCEDAQSGTRQFPKRFPQICGFQGSQLVVCCPIQQRKTGEISYKKCEEYSQYIYVTRPNPINLIGAKPIRRNECGHKEVPLILGGTPAKAKEFPHMAAIGYQELSGELSWKCGGTLISSRFVLTAAHCLYDGRNNLSATHVRLGIIKLNATRHRQDFKIAELIAHPDYKITSYYNDIGLIRLEKQAELNSHVIPACLYSKREISAEKAIATGWGDTTGLNDPSDKLLKVTLDIIDSQFCDEQYKNFRFKKLGLGILDDLQVCAGSEEVKDACMGDSGGPLQIYHTGDKIKCMYDVLGITSFGKGCGSRAGGYVRVSSYIKWIEDTVWP